RLGREPTLFESAACELGPYHLCRIAQVDGAWPSHSGLGAWPIPKRALLAHRDWSHFGRSPRWPGSRRSASVHFGHPNYQGSGNVTLWKGYRNPTQYNKTLSPPPLWL